MIPQLNRAYTAFSGMQKVAAGTALDVASRIKEVAERDPHSIILIFDDETSAQVEFDLRGSVEDVVARYSQDLRGVDDKKSGRGRPKLGVIARELTLLPRHWEWLATQSGGASATVRRLVEDARKRNLGKDDMRRARDVAYKFMSVMGGNLPLYEEALRALYAGKRLEFEQAIANWPKDIREHSLSLAVAGFTEPEA